MQGFQAVGSGFQAYQVPQPQQPQGGLDMSNLPPMLLERLQSVPPDMRGAYIAKFHSMVKERQASQQGFQPTGFQQPGIGASRGQQAATRPQPRQSWDSAGAASPSPAPAFHGGVQGLLPNSEVCAAAAACTKPSSLPPLPLAPSFQRYHHHHHHHRRHHHHHQFIIIIIIITIAIITIIIIIIIIITISSRYYDPKSPLPSTTLPCPTF